MRYQDEDETNARADYEAEMRRDWDSLTPAQQEDRIADQEADAQVAAERHAERCLFGDYAT